jgi:hypothetical protein
MRNAKSTSAGARIVRQLLHAHHGVFAAVILGDVSDQSHHALHLPPNGMT